MLLYRGNGRSGKLAMLLAERQEQCKRWQHVGTTPTPSEQQDDEDEPSQGDVDEAIARAAK